VRPTSSLTAADRAWISAFLATEPWFDFYWRCGLEDLSRGLDNRLVSMGRRRAGLVLGIRFDGVTVLSTVGELDEDELALLVDPPERLELHVRAAEASSIAGAVANRFVRAERLRYYLLAEPPAPAMDPRAARLGPADEAEVLAFFGAHYPETIVSRWMLELPFVGIRDGGELVATAGCIVVSDAERACHLGNFLTHPNHRGKGLAKAVGRSLLAVLDARGWKRFMLGVEEANAPAWRAYEALGFGLLGAREVVHLGAASR
jgi:RimJ/RimL family protein N-acetyltransferase